LKVYEFEGLAEVRALYAGLSKEDLSLVREWLAARAGRVWEACSAQNAAVVPLFTHWHPDWIGKTGADVWAGHIALAAARLAVAREHGFQTWQAVETSDAAFDLDFEEAVDHALSGRLEDLRAALANRPGLVGERSPFAHRAMLLHYMAANGVEFERQRVPLNAAAIVRVLRETGADPKATMPVYGGEHTAMELLMTSEHPKRAGVVKAMARALG